ncbi:Polyadenylate-binding protein-interacting protein 3 [Dionaea muscipula]
MNLQQALQPRSLGNGFIRRSVEKDVDSRLDYRGQSGKSNPSHVAGADDISMMHKVHVGVTSGSKNIKHESPSRDRLVYLSSCLIGHQVDVQVKNGSVFSGIFHAVDADKDFGVALKMACLTKDASSSGRVAGPDSVEKAPSRILIIPAHELVQVFAKDVPVTRNGVSIELQHEKQPELMLDSYISQSRHVEPERELERWVPDKDDPQCPESENIFGGPWTGSWDQFKVNETLFGVKSTFNEELYTTKLEKGPQMRELEEEALRIAREIEGEQTNDLHLAEERGIYPHGNFDIDEETRFSSVLRTFDDSGFDEEDAMLDSCNRETFGKSPGSAFRSLTEATCRRSHDGGRELSSSSSTDKMQSPQLNIIREVYQPDPLAFENSSWGVHAIDGDIRVQEIYISDTEQDGLMMEIIKTQVFSEEAETSTNDDLPDLPSSLDKKKEGSSNSGLSPDATEYTPSVISRKSPEKPSTAGEVSDYAVSSKVQGTPQSKTSGKASGPASSPNSSAGLLSSEKSSLNPNAKEFKFNPNAKSFTPSQTPLRPLSPVADSPFYVPAGMPSLPHLPGMPISYGIGHSFVSPQPVIFNPQAASIQSPQAYFPTSGPQYGQPMIIGHPRQVMYMPGYPTEIPYKGREF